MYLIKKIIKNYINKFPFLSNHNLNNSNYCREKYRGNGRRRNSHRDSGNGRRRNSHRDSGNGRRRNSRRDNENGRRRNSRRDSGNGSRKNSRRDSGNSCLIGIVYFIKRIIYYINKINLFYLQFLFVYTLFSIKEKSYSDGSIYNGILNNQIRDGVGMLSLNNTKFFGLWDDDKPYFGAIKWENSDIYIGFTDGVNRKEFLGLCEEYNLGEMKLENGDDSIGFIDGFNSTGFESYNFDDSKIYFGMFKDGRWKRENILLNYFLVLFNVLIFLNLYDYLKNRINFNKESTC